MNIIRRRLAKALRLNSAPSQYGQRRNPERKRKSMSKRGTRLLINHVHTMMSDAQLQELDALCERFAVHRGVVIRDAVDFYLGMARQEIEEAGPLRGIDAVPILLPPDKVRRPDGAVVSLYDTDPTMRAPKKTIDRPEARG